MRRLRFAPPLLLLCLLWACGEDDKSGPPGGPVTNARPPGAPAPTVAPSSTGRPQSGARADAQPPPSPVPAEPPPAPPAPSPSSAEPSPRPKPIDLEQACSEASADAPALKLGKVQLTSGLEDKKPIDELKEVHPGQKLYAYLEVGSEVGERCVSVRFRFGEHERATLTLDIGRSPRWRTWANVTVGKKDVGKTAEIAVFDDQGHELAKRTLPVVDD